MTDTKTAPPCPRPSTCVRMREAMQRFVDRVEAGEVRSVRTYAEFKAILSEDTDQRKPMLYWPSGEIK